MIRATAALIAVTALGACAGPVRTDFGGHAGGTVAGGIEAVAVTASGQSDERWPALAAALERRGLRVEAGSPYRLEFAFGTRPASSAILGAEGAVLAPAKKQRLFQSCADRDHRLVLAVVDARNGNLVARGWAEESHCHATAADALPSLAANAVAMLMQPVAAGTGTRWGRD